MKTEHPCAPTHEERRRQLLAGMSAMLLAALLLSFPMAGIAGKRSDHEDARRALLSGEVLSLRQVLDIVAREYPGEPIEIEFEHDDGMYLYELKLLQASGQIIKMKVEAASGKIISVKTRDGKKEDDD